MGRAALPRAAGVRPPKLFPPPRGGGEGGGGRGGVSKPSSVDRGRPPGPAQDGARPASRIDPLHARVGPKPRVLPAGILPDLLDDVLANIGEAAGALQIGSDLRGSMPEPPPVGPGEPGSGAPGFLEPPARQTARHP